MRFLLSLAGSSRGRTQSSPAWSRTASSCSPATREHASISGAGRLQPSALPAASAP
ncbi:hypothetical protein PF002_g31350 [Phytophthora fragariae]|uniref:Uncharacterized protein n=1 Tax=Phytophthora fragariae TaxID=53985 RepID=A0A6A3PQK6_9STRA|nr:hypothetical protein PF009_g30905 [Phytophthora fragariae]KAE8961434.1 hypothetical protein PF011_g29753 [Phytophthora fragariae]KAE9062491.1 hypothetical protein PF007_g29890 [Phytophthora fragariae]KAE9165512.1 hypothetical protein PF002_g31350 [Phytophthora fragariae]KAE9268838.1 hypothetical protein PF008_g31021 [Phytophthora fragariae]